MKRGSRDIGQRQRPISRWVNNRQRGFKGVISRTLKLNCSASSNRNRTSKLGLADEIFSLSSSSITDWALVAAMLPAAVKATFAACCAVTVDETSISGAVPVDNRKSGGFSETVGAGDAIACSANDNVVALIGA